MPPKVKVTKEAILNGAIEIVREKGIGGVNARDLASALGCSVQPLFSNFHNMDQLKQALLERVEALYDDQMQSGIERHPIPFLGMGFAYIDFAKTEKNLFKFLFMSDEFKGRNVLEMIQDDENKGIVEMIAGMTGLKFKKAEQLFLSIWLTTHGIASMMATNDCELSEEAIAGILTDSFSGIAYQLSKQGD